MMAWWTLIALEHQTTSGLSPARHPIRCPIPSLPHVPQSENVEYHNVWLYFCQRKRKLENLREQVAESERKRQSLEEQVKTASVGREDSVSYGLILTYC